MRTPTSDASNPSAEQDPEVEVRDPEVDVEGTTTGRWSPRAQRRRAQIIAAAHDVFVSRGFRNGSLAEIADRVGITHQGVLHYFGSKEELLAQVLDERDRTGRARAASNSRPHGADFLRHLVETVARNETRSQLIEAYTVLSAESVTEQHPARTWFRTRLRVLRSEIVVALRAVCGPDRTIGDDEFDRAACAIVAVMDGLQVQWLLEPDAVPMADTVRDVIDGVLRQWGVAPLDQQN